MCGNPFSKPKAAVLPETPEAPPPAATQDSPSAVAAAEEARRKRVARGGRRSTMLTDQSNIGGAQVSRKTLLGT